jgi:hypothetical protein
MPGKGTIGIEVPNKKFQITNNIEILIYEGTRLPSGDPEACRQTGRQTPTMNEKTNLSQKSAELIFLYFGQCDVI